MKMIKFRKEFIIVGLLAMGTGMMVSAVNAAPKKRPNGNAGRRPVRIVQLSKEATVVYSGPVVWGYKDKYHLQVLDNRGHAYGLGRPKEGFANVDPTGTVVNSSEPGGHLWGVVSEFDDTNAMYFNSDPSFRTPSITYGTYLFSFDQIWACYVGSPAKRYGLNTHHLTHSYGYTTRTVY